MRVVGIGNERVCVHLRVRQIDRRCQWRVCIADKLAFMKVINNLCALINVNSKGDAVAMPPFVEAEHKAGDSIRAAMVARVNTGCTMIAV